MKKIYYLWLRQIKKYVRSRARLIGTLAQPIIFLLMFGYGFGNTFAAAGRKLSGLFGARDHRDEYYIYCRFLGDGSDLGSSVRIFERNAGGSYAAF